LNGALTIDKWRVYRKSFERGCRAIKRRSADTPVNYVKRRIKDPRVPVKAKVLFTRFSYYSFELHCVEGDTFLFFECRFRDRELIFSDL